MSRRGGVREDVYEERGGYYRDDPPPPPPPPLDLQPQRIERVERIERIRAPPVRARDLEDIEYGRLPPRVDRDRQPEFMRRAEYAGPGERQQLQQQPLVLRKREVETYLRPVRRSPPRERSPSVERVRTRERVVERERSLSPSPPPVERVTTRTRMVERERSLSPPPVERVTTRTRVVERERSPSRSPSPPPVQRVTTRTRVVQRDRSLSRSPSPPPVQRVTTRTRMVERERSPSPERERISRTRVDVRQRSGSLDTERGGEKFTSTRVVERDTRERYREPSLERVRTTTRTVERERERSPSPPVQRETIRTRVVERERRRSPSIASSHSPPPEPPLIRAPAIHQEIITHHRHIDHGYDYAPAPTPPPSLPRSRPLERERETEIDIHTSKNNTEIDIYESHRRGGRERSLSREPDRLHVSARDSPRRSSSARPERRERLRDYDDEADYYARKADERAYIGEAYNGATKDWAIVDVPPGTERVKMDGVGGGSQEITWQRYNGVRRSNFEGEREVAKYDREYEREEVTDRRVGPVGPVGRPTPPAPLWTEITKDLVVPEAIKEVGYDFEETEFFFYIMQYLRYEDVLELVRISEEIRGARKRRIRDMARERDRLKDAGVLEPVPVRETRRLMPPPGYEEERVYERDVVYDRERRHPKF